MPCVYVLKNLNNKKLCIGLTDDFGGEFEKNQKSILVSIKFFKDKKEAGKFEKHLKSKKGLADFKLKMKNKALGIMD
ncbi:MAG: hypothetical protein US71_C0002G0016 [Parcubacteria group bacterium GW2011_GWD2_38_12]|uniref:GIY-YIG domain-containing protein n=1 Tax=Candidatus Azambacteria bacterium RIFCSPLOWO2_01_FULL_37_9 TaxID=1797297 RepID=A0A1F5C7J5_9BACT|nr:MAG: hypothetical protein US06_C0003G0042 [Parcubacteria group bacterium GW2011_GWC2_36_17]KKQ38219.1 MAG: hypothetical protein US56_C0048G0005 [Candidatus Moranbacteria bacterium GW2011_GWF2_37_7]KKQ43734.1 MAG: hypothetical protein US61_C0004G0003 [Parcubacteria group bacterium GW2011_GWE2_37_8]KKQ52619.1 MAG: hypothetical protein US71_C0002G0016 [Parcubacteria group bacterium GW2011_GWD2_38_12]KKQ59572.1 MAG: hypothetical protein US78_C0002G0035 [Parcubacteria group bacterium GW2011_GWD1_